jgi:hypothetical protein
MDQNEDPRELELKIEKATRIAARIDGAGIGDKPVPLRKARGRTRSKPILGPTYRAEALRRYPIHP